MRENGHFPRMAYQPTTLLTFLAPADAGSTMALAVSATIEADCTYDDSNDVPVVLSSTRGTRVAARAAGQVSVVFREFHRANRRQRIYLGLDATAAAASSAVNPHPPTRALIPGQPAHER